MRMLLAPIVVPILLSACASSPGMHAGLQTALLGLWCNSQDQGRSCWAWDEFKPDGTLAMCGRHDGEVDPFSASAKVSWVGDRMCYTVTESTPNFWLRPGQRYCTQIVSVTPAEHAYRDIDTGAVFTLVRRPLAAKACPK